ncbi:DUF2975 domain-containing protein [Gracilibacillus timonensis]|uniref:DUF2975 domain-containing protein n=1 Tax=Gracilibacillus timonensis TaxID=1816696 RepID=UPI0008267D51|nr:DUF2975 domain-containing protein [Gracilibacillus timonensis]
MKRKSTLFLKVAVVLIGIPVLALCIFLLPRIAHTAMVAAENGSSLAYMVFGLLSVMYISTIPFYIALYQAFKLLGYIDHNKAFSELSVKTLTKIRNAAITISGLYVVAMPLIFIIAEWDDAPGLLLIGLVVMGASVVIAVFAAVLKRLLQEAIEIKSENELTI